MHQPLADVTVAVLLQPLADVPVAALLQPLVEVFGTALHQPLAAVPLRQLLVYVTMTAPQHLLADLLALPDVPLCVLADPSAAPAAPYAAPHNAPGSATHPALRPAPGTSPGTAPSGFEFGFADTAADMAPLVPVPLPLVPRQLRQTQQIQHSTPSYCLVQSESQAVIQID